MPANSHTPANVPAAAMPAAAIPLTEAEFERLRGVIAQLCGLHFGDNKHYLLETRLQERLAALKLPTFSDYLRVIENPAARGDEAAELFRCITTNETSFWRNPAQIAAFRDEVLPQIIAKKRAAGAKRLRLWSAGCSSGEEPYTLAILIADALGKELPLWKVEITGNDISEDMLARGRAATYDEHALRGTPDEIRAAHFDAVPTGEWQVKPRIRSLVKFAALNLSDDAALAAMRPFDAVFCRNVLIYFDAAAKQRLVARFRDALPDGGHLFIGHGESLAAISSDFTLVQLRGTVVYVKKPAP
jgi:chemotaxis protein methyltransferase CheR